MNAENSATSHRTAREPSGSTMAPQVKFGLEICAQRPQLLGDERRRYGVLMNHASVDSHLRLSCDVLHDVLADRLTAILSPQHGLWGLEQANMIESDHTRYAPLDLPVYSLYCETRRPTAQMLESFDCLIIDLQDVGTRVYTFAWTMLECLHACAEANKSVVVLDRPNPIGGIQIEGPTLSDDFRSFVGGAAIPLRHGLTMAELARLFVREQSLDVELTCVAMDGWRREMLFAETQRHWVWPSPNMPTVQTATVYPGGVLLEGTNLSEGRGTTRPFELVGGPFLDPQALVSELQSTEHPGLQMRPANFRPVADNWAGEPCGGVELHVVDADAVRSVQTFAQIIAAAARQAPHQFQWLSPPYEYENVKMPIDILFGNSDLRTAVDSHTEFNLSDIGVAPDASYEASWWRRAAPALLYDR